MKITVGYNPPNPYHPLSHFDSGDVVLSELGSVPYLVYEVVPKQLVAFPLGPGGYIVSDREMDEMNSTRFRALKPGERVVIEGE